MIGRPVLRLIAGSAATRSCDRVAFSLVHPVQRIDVPIGAVLEIEACAQQTFQFEDGSLRTFDTPHVRVALASDVRARLYRLTSALMRMEGDFGKTIDILVGDESVARPIVCEALGTQPDFWISVYSVAEAEALVAKLRSAFPRTELRMVSTKPDCPKAGEG